MAKTTEEIGIADEVSTNKNIADVFFKAGYVETWGRIGKILATEELSDLVNKGLIQQTGTKGRGSKYELMQKI